MESKPDNNTPKKGNGRLVILGVFAAFLIPVIIAMLMQSDFWSYQPESSKAHGTLIKPVVEMIELREIIEDRSKWWLVSIASGNCDQTCEQTLIGMRQLRKATGAHSSEVGLLFVSADTSSDEQQQRIKAIETKIRQINNPVIYALINNTGSGTETAGKMWLLDRELNLFMHYPAGHNATGVRKDLKRILTWAQEKPE
ncbi:MAG: SCO family protein [Xanthomonadales bacterium]|nr:SCO family protein [Xanthomonadales bacterium]